MAQDPVPADVFALLDDEYARGILKATNRKPMSAPQLAEELDASEPTVYRRVERLRGVGLLSESTELSDSGHHRSVYRARLERVVVELADDGFSISVDRAEHPADRFTEMWEDV